MDMMTVGRIFYKFNATFSFKVVDARPARRRRDGARIDARSGNSMLGRPASSFDTGFDNAKQDSTYLDAKIV
jgi:hypothetical protein